MQSLKKKCYRWHHSCSRSWKNVTAEWMNERHAWHAKPTCKSSGLILGSATRQVPISCLELLKITLAALNMLVLRSWKPWKLIAIMVSIYQAGTQESITICSKTMAGAGSIFHEANAIVLSTWVRLVIWGFGLLPLARICHSFQNRHIEFSIINLLTYIMAFEWQYQFFNITVNSILQWSRQVGSTLLGCFICTCIHVYSCLYPYCIHVLYCTILCQIS